MTHSLNANGPVRLRVIGIAIMVLVFLSCQTSGFAQTAESTVDGALHDPPTTGWAIGDAFQRQLEKPVGIAWQSVPLREAVTRLSVQSRVAIFFDRNMDPNVRITLRSKNGSFDRVFRSLADRLGIAVAQVGSVLYLGPQFTASRISTLAALRNDEVSRLPKARAAVWRKRGGMQWPRLSEPRKIVEELAAENSLKIVNTKRIPYDLWPAGDFPELTVAERLSLLLVGFKLTYQFDKQNNVRLVPFPSSVAVERSYSVSDASIIAKLKGQFPQAGFERNGDTLAARTTVEEHQAIRETIGVDKPKPEPKPVVPKTASLEDKRFQLRLLNKKFGDVIRQLVEQIDVDLDVAPEAKVDLNQLITVEVKDATIDELMTAVLEPVGLRHERTGSKVMLLPAKTPTP